MDRMETNSIGKTIKKLRWDMNLSLDAASKLTGVSKAMLGQIERGESMPTISTLWKISAGLKVTLSNFISMPDGIAFNRLEDIQPLEEEDGQMLLFNIFPFDPVSGFDYLYITMEEGCRHVSVPHANVVMEYIFVSEGCLEMTIQDKSFILQKGNALHFQGSLNHTYANCGEGIVVFHNIIKYM